jgi:hypothetical protein
MNDVRKDRGIWGCPLQALGSTVAMEAPSRLQWQLWVDSINSISVLN